MHFLRRILIVSSLFAIIGAGAFRINTQSKGNEPEIKKTEEKRYLSAGNAAGQWLQFRGDRQMTGRSDINGEIKTPAIKWKHMMASRETLLAVSLASGNSECALPMTDVEAPFRNGMPLLADWGVGAPLVNLDGAATGTLSALPQHYNEKAGQILPGRRDWQWIVAEGDSSPNPTTGTVRLKVRQNGQWVDKWATGVDSLIWESEPIFGDFDHDGRMDIALLPWYRMNILDAETGKIKERCTFMHDNENPGFGGRCYGRFGAYDLDGDGKDEFVLMDHFTHHMEVLGWKNGKLERLWIKIFQKPEPGNAIAPPERLSIQHLNPEPLQDVDGDGRKEIVTCIYNPAGDQRWHTWVINALTGEIRLDLPSEHLEGARDVDGDEVAELFCTHVDQGMRVPVPAEISIFSWCESKLTSRWKLKGANFATYDLPCLPSNVNSGVLEHGLTTILCSPIKPGGGNVFLTQKKIDNVEATVELTVWQSGAEHKIHSIAEVSGPRLEVVTARAEATGNSGLLLKSTAFDQEAAVVTCSNCVARILASHRVPAPVTPAVAGRLEPGAPPVVVVQGANETIEALRPQADGSVKRLWRVPGRGMTYNNVWGGVLLADLTGNGKLSTVVGTRGPGDCARLQVLSPKGKEVWHKDFPDFPGAPPPYLIPGLIYWQAGYFNDSKRMDLLVQMCRIGGESTMVDGRNGKSLWTRFSAGDSKAGPMGRDFGRNWMTIFDYDGDGLEDVMSNFPDIFSVANGKTGKLLLSCRAAEFVKGAGYFGSTMTTDFLGNGRQQMLFVSQWVVALLDLDGKRIWHGPYDEKSPDYPNFGTEVRPAFGDSDGKGKLDIFLPYIKTGGTHEFQCWEAATGKLKWKLPMPVQPTVPAVADIDGDGREDCIFTAGNQLIAVCTNEDGHSGKIKWTMPLPAAAGPIAIADIQGKGLAEIVVVCADGGVYGIGAR